MLSSMDWTEPAVWREPVRGQSADPQMLAMSGLRRMEVGVAGLVPAPPIHHLTGMRPTSVSEGVSEFKMPATGWWRSLGGVFLGGALAWLADAPLGTSVLSLLPRNQIATTSELSMSYIRPATVRSGELVATSRAIHVGRSVGLSDVLVKDSAGTLLAHGSSRLFVTTVPLDVSEPEIGDVAYSPPLQSSPDPFMRDAVGHVMSLADLEKMSGLEMWQRYLSGELAPPPIHHLFGVRPREASEGRVVWVMNASEWLLSPAPYLYGGAIAMFADAALMAAVSTVAPAGCGYASLDLKIHFLRPVMPDGEELLATATVTHRGRTFVVADVEIVNSQGKKVALGTGSSILLPDRIRDLLGQEDPEMEIPVPDQSD